MEKEFGIEVDKVNISHLCALAAKKDLLRPDLLARV